MHPSPCSRTIDLVEWLTSPAAWVALASLTVLEIVLGIDNIVFISILAGKLPEEQRDRARVLGLALAMLTRIALLFSISLLSHLTAPLFTVFGMEITGRDLVFLLGGVFLIYKATQEIHDRLEGPRPAHHEAATNQRAATFAGVLTQIALLDVVFSLDSVITAVGMADHLVIMIAAVVIAVGVMMLSVNSVAGFVERHPTVKMLALSFLLLIGTTLVAEGLGQHVPKGYVYFAMGFSVMVELFNLRARAVRHPVTLDERGPKA